MATVLKIVPCVRVRRVLPLTVLADVAVSADRQPGIAIRISEESGRSRRRVLVGRNLDEDALRFDTTREKEGDHDDRTRLEDEARTLHVSDLRSAKD
jgi:hypothetical protein